jgi:hypothetical protein
MPAPAMPAPAMPAHTVPAHTVPARVVQEFLNGYIVCHNVFAEGAARRRGWDPALARRVLDEYLKAGVNEAAAEHSCAIYAAIDTSESIDAFIECLAPYNISQAPRSGPTSP